jgi:AcrR family transcriptional regulator
VRFLAQGLEETSAEQIAADAGVSLRTFYRHFASKNELLFGDYDASLAWFRTALESRPAEESVTEAVLAAIDSFPFDREAMYDIAALRARELDREQVGRHIQQVQAEFAVEVERHLLRRGTRRGRRRGFSSRWPPSVWPPPPLPRSTAGCGGPTATWTSWLG